MTPWFDQEHAWLLGFSINQLWTFLGPLAAGIIGSLLTRWYRNKDDKEARREEWLAGKFQETYLLIGEAREYPGMPLVAAYECKQKLSIAINQIDLFADEETKEAATNIVRGYSEGREWIEYDQLQTALRDRFRTAMGLPKLNSKVVGLNVVAPAATSLQSPAAVQPSDE